jgi:hypothetical protein
MLPKTALPVAIPKNQNTSPNLNTISHSANSFPSSPVFSPFVQISSPLPIGEFFALNREESADNSSSYDEQEEIHASYDSFFLIDPPDEAKIEQNHYFPPDKNDDLYDIKNKYLRKERTPIYFNNQHIHDKVDLYFSMENFNYFIGGYPSSKPPQTHSKKFDRIVGKGAQLTTYTKSADCTVVKKLFNEKSSKRHIASPVHFKAYAQLCVQYGQWPEIFVPDFPSYHEKSRTLRFYAPNLSLHSTWGKEFIASNHLQPLHLNAFVTKLCAIFAKHPEITMVDLKPENLFIDKKTFSIKIIDLAHQLPCFIGIPRGTPFYLIGYGCYPQDFTYGCHHFYKNFYLSSIGSCQPEDIKKSPLPIRQNYDGIQSIYALLLTCLVLHNKENHNDELMTGTSFATKIIPLILNLCHDNSKEYVKNFLVFTREMSYNLDQPGMLQKREKIYGSLSFLCCKIIESGEQGILFKNSP